jgi:basic membrane protein A and related proteins
MNPIFRIRRTLALLVVPILLVACAGGDDPEPVDDVPAEDAEVEAGDDDSSDDPEEDSAEDADAAPEDAPGGEGLRFAAILSGPVTDGDFNAVQLGAIEHLETLGVATAYSEEVSVSDADRLARQYVSEGYDIVALQAAAYLPTVLELAQEFPDTIFWGITSGQPIPDQPENVWALGLDTNPSYYVLGYLAGQAVGPDGTVAMIAGLEIPPLVGGANAMFAGARAAEPEVGLDFVFTGDFNDPVIARQATSELIDRGADVIAMHLNAAIPGAVEAINDSQDVRWMAHFTDKSDIDPDSFIAAMVWDMEAIFETLLGRVTDGELGGSIVLTEWLEISEVSNVDEAVAASAQEVLEDVKSGAVDVPAKFDEVEIPD